MSLKVDSNVQLAKPCVIPICEGRKFNLVHKFPADYQRCNEWLEAIQKERPIEKLQDKTHDAIRKRYFVCARHFDISAYKNVESRSLNLTSVPHINLTNLNDYAQSKAYQLEQSQQQIETCQKNTIPPTILNKLANNSIKVESNAKSIKRSYHEIQENVITSHDVVTPPKTSITKGEEIEKIIKTPRVERQPAPLPAQTNDISILSKTSEPSNEEPKGKILALLEVNSAQYKKLLSVINLGTNVVVIDNAENELSISPDNEVEIIVDGKRLNIDKFWLRDHCRCDECFDQSTNQRKTSILTISDDISIKNKQLKLNKFHVIWDDGHESIYDTSFLIENQHEKFLEMQSNKVHWTKEFMSNESNICRVKMRDYMSDPDVSRKVLEGLHLYGFAFIDGVQPTQQNTEFVIRQLFPIHKTLFGEMWTFSDEKKDHMDTAYTNYYLGPHNDNTYFNDASGLQVLHCIMHQCTGGENFLIDGFQVAEKIKKNHPETFDRLTKTMVPAEYIEKDCHHKYIAPIIKLDQITEEILQIRFNLYDRAPLNTISNKFIRQFYKDLKILAAEFENVENRISFKLEPGTVLIFDNWRVLHGRHAYDGKRTMTGCYVQRSEFLSVLRVNGFIN